MSVLNWTRRNIERSSFSGVCLQTAFLNEARAEDHQTMLAQMDRLQQQHVADYLVLRKDLETVAALTDDELRRTRQGLRHFAADNTSARGLNQP